MTNKVKCYELRRISSRFHLTGIGAEKCLRMTCELLLMRSAPSGGFRVVSVAALLLAFADAVNDSLRVRRAALCHVTQLMIRHLYHCDGGDGREVFVIFCA